MGKIKLNLVSGAVVEKPLISAFKASENSYVILDNEINGSMGLPIILVCKFENNKLVKIIDQNEWQLVKEYLKNIIAGNHVEYFNVISEMTADDIYYTQLTLPVPSFDALKNAYHVEDVVTPESNLLDINPAQIDMNNISSMESVVPEVNPSTPVIDINVSEIQSVQSESVNISAPAIDLNTPIPNFGGDTQVNPIPEVTPVEPVSQVMPEPEITPPPVINGEINTSADNASIFKEQKEAFMQACENMFDALVQKFEKELENRK